MPEVLTATHVVIVEGEKDAERVKKASARFKKWNQVGSWAATTCSGGADGWRTEYAPYFAGKAVYILPDNDDAGRKFAEKVARSVSSFARFVKIVDLPGLRKKEDVSDFLDTHRANQLLAQLRKAARYEPNKFSAQNLDGSAFNPVPLREYFDAPEEQQSWLVDDLLPSAGLSIVAAKPKTGKSTLARQLALSVAQGSDFFGRGTRRGEVIYLALEEKQQEITAHFRALGATGDESIRIHCAPAPAEALHECQVLLKNHPASLLIIDPLFKFARVKDGNDYAQMTGALEPILTLARQSGTHVLLVHHTGKNERSDAADAILGSTAILGNVDTAIILARRDNYRTILTRQRYGLDLPESLLNFDPDRRAMTLGASREQAVQEKVEQDIIVFLGSNAGAREAEILDAVSGRKQGKVAALRRLLDNRVRRQGKGGKSDPYKYFLVPCSPHPDNTAGTRTQNRPKPIESNGEIVVPRSAGTTGNKNRVSSSSNGCSMASRPAYNGGMSPSEFSEQVAILEIDGHVSRAEAARAVRESLRREKQ
jgi:5S rRNA maturation endonuclease (ribonuclease M5)